MNIRLNASSLRAFWRQRVPPISTTHTHRRLHSGPKEGDKVVVAMSGGVDSSVVAQILAKKNYNLSAVYMRNWDTRDEKASDVGCEWEKEWEDVQRVCQLLNLPCELLDFSRAYWTDVFEPCLAIWQSGHTPNPDILCNRHIKFGQLVEKYAADDTWLATGHYAAKLWDTTITPPRPFLKRPRDRVKDQTYFLSSISDHSLRRVLFPLSDLTKSEVRELARQHGLPTADRPESMGICFIGQKRSFKEFLMGYLPVQRGAIVDPHRKFVGVHDGLWTRTIGQKMKLGDQKEKWYVAGKDGKRNEIIAVPGKNHPFLRCNSVVVYDWEWLWRDLPPVEWQTDNLHDRRLECTAQYRSKYSDSEVPCIATQRDDGAMIITFVTPESGVANGQTIALYQDDCCLGSGTMSRTISPSFPSDSSDASFQTHGGLTIPTTADPSQSTFSHTQS